MSSLTIRKYQPGDFPLLEKWFTDEELLFQFAGPDWHFPITEEQIRRHQEKFPFKQLYIGEDENKVPVALGELIWNEPNSPRIGRLLVGDPAKRGKGVGEQLIRELIRELMTIAPSPVIFLYVLESNVSAIGLYQKLGFKTCAEEGPVMVFRGKPMKTRKMAYAVPT